jgi:hypothetical protein
VSVQALLGSADSQKSRVKIFSNLFVWLNVNTGDHPDIALFRLTNDLALNAYVNTVRLPSRAQENNKFIGYTMVEAGWGGDGSGGFPRYLQWADFTIYNGNDCSFGHYDVNYLCSKQSNGPASLVGGDSGDDEI